VPIGDDNAARAELHVAAGIIEDGAGRVLIAQRPPGGHMGGGWEFPGGKVREGETNTQALHRELAEEIGIEVRAAEPFIAYRHEYRERTVLLDVWRVTEFRGEPRALEGQPLRWEAVDRLMSIGLLPADLPIVDALLARRGR
jgi:8-oxo-dGTP diphosphatase